MATAKKEAAVSELKALVERAAIVIGAEYRGLSVREMTALRRVLNQADVEVRVVKNRLFQLATRQAGIEDAGHVAEGPTLVIFGYGDVVAPARAVADYARTARNAFAPKKAYLDGALHDGSIVGELASLPSREELIAKLAGALISPVQDLATLLNDSIQTFARLVDARANQLEGDGA